MNKLIISGNLTKDPELQKDKNNDPYCMFTVAVNEGSGEHKRVDYFFCKASKKNAENLCQYKKKGDFLIVSGKMRSYKKPGDEYDRWALDAWDIEFGPSIKRDEDSGSGGSKRGRSGGGVADGATEVDDDDMPF